MTKRGGAAVAFEILAQHDSPIGSNLGVAGVLLSSFGFFVAPAIIGALVGAVYVNSSKLSAKAVDKRFKGLQDQIQAILDRGTR